MCSAASSSMTPVLRRLTILRSFANTSARSSRARRLMFRLNRRHLADLALGDGNAEFGNHSHCNDGNTIACGKAEKNTRTRTAGRVFPTWSAPPAPCRAVRDHERAVAARNLDGWVIGLIHALGDALAPAKLGD
jgi:hypothetical protein